MVRLYADTYTVRFMGSQQDQFLVEDVISSNKPAAGNAGWTLQLTIGHHRPGVPEPERSVKTP
jgi:hypothetical protein